MKNKKRSLSYNSDKKRRILIGCSIAGTAVLMTGTGIGIGYAIWYNNNDKTGWDFDSKSYDKYDNEVSQAPDGTYDAFSAREEYLRNFEINFKVDFRHYVNDSIRSFATFSNVETSYDVFITKHNFDVDRGLIKDFQATVFLTLYTDEQEQGTERFTLNVHNYYLLGAFTPANIYFDEATPTHAHTNA
ncbi:hypothetical protein FACS1894218_6110 [Bacilli bacterium]|nr:hypothetical protein FACS1894218_6110 [Bacilli bacterium]